jgi:two-component system sensor histidine kinase KdpD
LKQFIANKTSPSKQYLAVILIILGVSGICFLLQSILDYRIAAFVLLVAVSVVAMLFDIWPVLLSALLSALIWDFFFIPPHFTFHIGSTSDMIMFLMYFVIASVNAVLTYKIRELTKIAA